MVPTSTPSPITPDAAHAAVAHTLLQAARDTRLRREPASPDALASARQALATGTSEDLATAASLAGAWELPEAPRLAALPDTLWGAYVEWLLAAPETPTPEQAAPLARHLALRCEELAGWMERNLASPAVRAAADAYLRTPPPPLAALPAEARLALQLARARILRRTLGRAAPPPRAPRSRTDRALKVGLLHARFDHRPETFSTLARCTWLDPRRVELHCVALEPSGTALEENFRRFASSFGVLPEGLAEQLRQLDALALDCLVFGDDLAAHAFPLAHLAQLRAAPLQIAFGPLTTALPGVDLLLAGETDPLARSPRAVAERLGLLPGTAFACDTSPDRPADTFAWTRAALGLPDDRPLLVETAPASPTAADLARWRAILASAPTASLLLLPEPGRYDLSAVRSAIDAAALPGLVLHEPAPANHAELASLVGLADLAIDLSGPAAALAMEAGVPVFALAESPAEPLLRTAALDEAVFPDEATRTTAIVRLLENNDARAEVRTRFVASAESLPRFADTYALAADFATLLEHAWDRLCAEGHGKFRRQREPLRLATPHSLHPGDLHAEALASLSGGRPERAVPCLLSALQRAGADAALWFDLARAYRASGEMSSAIETLEASLRLDANNAAAWRLLCELAAEAGNLDLAREALDLAAGLAAEHPDLAALRARVAA